MFKYQFVLPVGECKQLIYIGFINPPQLCYGSIYGAVGHVREKALVLPNWWLQFLIGIVLKMGSIGPSEKLVRNYHYLLCNNPEEQFLSTSWW